MIIKLITSIFFLSIFIFVPDVMAQECAQVSSVRTLGSQSIAINTPFTCIVSVENPTEAQRLDIACGVSINGGRPQNFCPSHNDGGINFFGGWRGNDAYFDCLIPNTSDVLNATRLELVGDDDSSEACKQSTRTAIPITIAAKS